MPLPMPTPEVVVRLVYRVEALENDYKIAQDRINGLIPSALFDIRLKIIQDEQKHLSKDQQEIKASQDKLHATIAALQVKMEEDRLEAVKEQNKNLRVTLGTIIGVGTSILLIIISGYLSPLF